MSDNYDVIIIGSGPAGNTSAIYLTRAGLNTVMVTGYEEGGQLTTTTKVENYPGFPDGVDGPELMEKMLQQCKNLNVPMIKENVTKVDFSKEPYACTLTNEKVIYGKYIIISTGAKAKYLGHPNEKKFLGKGVSGCATCDGFFSKKKYFQLKNKFFLIIKNKIPNKIFLFFQNSTKLFMETFLNFNSSKATLSSSKNSLLNFLISDVTTSINIFNTS